jgi:hypothetical protein
MALDLLGVAAGGLRCAPHQIGTGKALSFGNAVAPTLRRALFPRAFAVPPTADGEDSSPQLDPILAAAANAHSWAVMHGRLDPWHLMAAY